MAASITTPKTAHDYPALLGQLPREVAQAPGISSPKAFSIASEANLTLPASLMEPAGSPRGILVAVDDGGRGRLADSPVVQEVLRRGWAVCGVDPRAIGELASPHLNWLFAIHLLLGDYLPWRQGWDLAQAARFIAAAPQFARLPVVYYGRGQTASLAASYALAMPATRRLARAGFILQDSFLSFRQFLDRPENERLSFRLQHATPEQPLDHEIPPAYFVFDALRHFDLPVLFREGNLPGLALDPIDGDWHPLSLNAARALLPANVRAASLLSSTTSVLDFLRSLEGTAQ